MPRASDTARDNLPFAEWPVLMLADVGDSRDFSVVFEDRHPFTGNTHDAGAIFGNIRNRAGVDKAFVSYII